MRWCKVTGETNSGGQQLPALQSLHEFCLNRHITRMQLHGFGRIAGVELGVCQFGLYLLLLSF
jgi:hypothetical protein